MIQYYIIPIPPHVILMYSTQLLSNDLVQDLGYPSDDPRNRIGSIQAQEQGKKTLFSHSE